MTKSKHQSQRVHSGMQIPGEFCIDNFDRFSENITPHLRLEAGLNRVLFDAQSDFQKVQIIETEPFGKTLVLDGKTQSALVDEHIYHETLVHAAMLQHPEPKTVYIGGGGEFATAREVLKHKSVTKVVMVDIDQVVCSIIHIYYMD